MALKSFAAGGGLSGNTLNFRNWPLKVTVKKRPRTTAAASVMKALRPTPETLPGANTKINKKEISYTR